MSIQMHDINVANNITATGKITGKFLSAQSSVTGAGGGFFGSKLNLVYPIRDENNNIIVMDALTIQDWHEQKTSIILNTLQNDLSIQCRNCTLLHNNEDNTTTKMLEILYDDSDIENPFINIAGVLKINNNIPLHSENFNSYAPTLNGDGAFGEWEISAYPRVAQLDTFSSSYPILLKPLTENGPAYYNNNLQITKLYDGREHFYALQIPELLMGETGVNNTLSRKTINIAGTNVNIWGGTLSTDDLVASLEEHGINATSANYANSAGRAEALEQNNGSAGSSSSPVYFDDGLPIECKMTSITLYSSNNYKNTLSPPQPTSSVDVYYDLPPFPSGNDTCTLLSNIFIQGAQGDTYGFTQSDLPSNPESGQIFFKADESSENIISVDNGKWIPAIPYIYISND